MEGAFAHAFRLIATGDRELLAIALTSIRISVLSTVITALISLPLGTLVALRKFPGRNTLITILNTLMALPTVVVALAIYTTISRNGPLGMLDLLFSQWAIVIGQTVLATPIVTALTVSAIEQGDPRLRETLTTLGARGRSYVLTLLAEHRRELTAAVLTGFGRVIGEVGVSMILGGNIRWRTRTMTTAIALETSRGAFELALALGIILLTIALMINAVLTSFSRRKQWASR